MPTPPTDPNIVHWRAFVVRKRTRDREPIFYTVTQWRNEQEELTIATIKMPDMKQNEFESVRFVLDYCSKGIQAAGYAEELNSRVNGNRR